MPRLFIANKGKAGYAEALLQNAPPWRKYGIQALPKAVHATLPKLLLRISLLVHKSYDKVHCGTGGIVV